MRKALLLIACLFVISACGQMNSPDSQNALGNEATGDRVAYGLLGPGPINYGVIRDDNDEYRYDGLINQSPSFRTLDRHRQDLGDDEDKIRTVLTEEGVEPGMVFIIGKDVWVNATVQVKNDEELKKKQEQLENVLSRAMQRYDIHLQIEKTE